MKITRGRKSAAGRQTSIPKIRHTPKPPAGLSEAASALWDDIVASLPADFFRPGDLPLLAAYCTAADRKNLLDASILNEGVLFDGVAHPGLKVSRDEAALMASLAGKLRLCPSSRTRPDAAALKQANTSLRPWDEPYLAEKYLCD